MSDLTFLEAQSQNPVEQALARKALCPLNDPSLQRQRLHEAAALHEQGRALPLPQGCRVVSVHVSDGQVQVTAVNGRALVWLDADPAPTGVAANRPLRTLNADAERHQEPHNKETRR